jgi:TonB family protein
MRRGREPAGLGVWVAVAAAAHAGVVAALLGLPSRALVPAGEGPAVEWAIGPDLARGADAGDAPAADAPAADAPAADTGGEAVAEAAPDAVVAADARVMDEPEMETLPAEAVPVVAAESVAGEAATVVSAEMADVDVAVDALGAADIGVAGGPVVTETPPVGGVAPRRPQRAVARAAARAAPVRAAVATPAGRAQEERQVPVGAAGAPGAATASEARVGGGGGDEGADSREVAAWRAALSAWIARNQTYPPAARHRHDQGVVQVRFSLDEGGRVVAVSVVRESGSAILDAAALALLRDAHLPAPPRRLEPARRTITVPIRYRLQ